MDIEMIDAFLPGDYTYQNVEKPLFIKELALVFHKFEEGGNTKLISFEGVCNAYNKGKFGYTFVGNTSYNYINYI